jgi:hypothetical protein
MRASDVFLQPFGRFPEKIRHGGRKVVRAVTDARFALFYLVEA